MALREINLIPSEILARREFRRHLFFWTGCMAISLSLIWGFYFYQEHRLLAKKRTITELKEMHASLGTKIDEIRRIRADLDTLRQRQAGLANIAINASYSQIFAKLADIMNEHTWLTQLMIDSGLEEGSEISLRLTGFSFSAEELGNFLNQLSSESMFKTVVLQRAREYETGQISKNSSKPIRLIQFNIECNVARV